MQLWTAVFYIMLGDCITTSVYERNTKNAIILHIESKRAPKCYPKCGHPHLVKNGFRTRYFISLPIGGKKVILRMKCPPLQVQVCGLWLSGTDILCSRQSQLHSSVCKVCGRSIKGNDPQTLPIFGACRGTRSKRFTLIILSITMLRPLLREWTASA